MSNPKREFKLHYDLDEVVEIDPTSRKNIISAFISATDDDIRRIQTEITKPIPQQ